MLPLTRLALVVVPVAVVAALTAAAVVLTRPDEPAASPDSERSIPAAAAAAEAPVDLGAPGDLVTVQGLVLLDCDHSSFDACTFVAPDGGFVFLYTGYERFDRMPRRGSVVEVRAYTQFSPRFRDDMAALSLESDSDPAGRTWVKAVGTAKRLNVRGLVGEIDPTYEQVGEDEFRPTGKEWVHVLAPVWSPQSAEPVFSHGEEAATFTVPPLLRDELVASQWDSDARPRTPDLVTFSLRLHAGKRGSGYVLVGVEPLR